MAYTMYRYMISGIKRSYLTIMHHILQAISYVSVHHNTNTIMSNVIPLEGLGTKKCTADLQGHNMIFYWYRFRERLFCIVRGNVKCSSVTLGHTAHWDRVATKFACQHLRVNIPILPTTSLTFATKKAQNSSLTTTKTKKALLQRIPCRGAYF